MKLGNNVVIAYDVLMSFGRQNRSISLSFLISFLWCMARLTILIYLIKIYRGLFKRKIIFLITLKIFITENIHFTAGRTRGYASILHVGSAG